MCPKDDGVVGQQDEQRRTNRLVWAVVIAAALVAGAAAGLAKGFAAGWPIIVAVIVGAVAWPIANAVKAQLEQRQKNTATRRALTAGAADIRRVRDTRPTDLRVHRPVRADVPYIERDLEPDVIEALRFDRRILIVGPSGVGKTCLALSCARRLAGDFQFYEPADGKSLHQRLADGATFDNALVWLDDLERFVAGSGLSDQDLATLLSRSQTAVVVATIRTTEYDRLQPNGDIKPVGWEVPAWFGEALWLEAGWSEDELARLGSTGPGQEVLPQARRYGLANYLAGAPLIERQLKIGAEQRPVGYAVVQATADWQRTGIKQRLQLDVLRTLVNHYTLLRQATPADEQIQAGLGWATQKLTHTLALVADRAGFEVPDLVQDHFAGSGPIPVAVWNSAIDAAATDELVAIGFNAYELKESQISISAWTKAADAGDTRAMFNFGVLLQTADPPDLDGARHWFQKAAEAGDMYAMNNLADLLEKRELWDEAETWYRKAAEAGDRQAMHNLANLLYKRGKPDEAEALWHKAAEAHFTPAMFNLAVLLNQQGKSGEAETWYRKAAEAGDMYAMNNLADLLEKRELWDEAQTWYRKAAEAGHSAAMVNLGVLLNQQGKSGEAETWYRKAAEAGEVQAMFNLGVLSERRRDFYEAETWYAKAASAGHRMADQNLMMLWQERGLYGRGVASPDDTEIE
jgi:TPR repeat protein/DNA polymerase III delta prime subunit